MKKLAVLFVVLGDIATNLRRSFTSVAIFLVLLLGFLPQGATAGPVGVTVNCIASIGNCLAIDNGVTLGEVIDPGAEFTFHFIVSFFDIDISSTSMVLTSRGGTFTAALDSN